MNCTSLPPLTLTWTSEKLALRAGSIVQSPKLILRLICVTMWGGEHHSNIPGCTTANSPIPRPTSGTQGIIQRVINWVPPHPPRETQFFLRCQGFDLWPVKDRAGSDRSYSMWASVWATAAPHQVLPASRSIRLVLLHHICAVILADQTYRDTNDRIFQAAVVVSSSSLCLDSAGIPGSSWRSYNRH